MADWGNMLSNNIFSIVMCLMLFWKLHESDKAHKEESNKFAEAINNNTIAITTLTEMLREKSE